MLLLGGLLAGLALGQIESPARPTRTIGAVRVIDGDTFVEHGVRIRIADIDAPEPHGRCASERALARTAAARLDVLLGDGPYELRGAGPSADRYGRTLRVVSRYGRSLGETLIAEGLARRWSGRRATWCA